MKKLDFSKVEFRKKDVEAIVETTKKTFSANETVSSLFMVLARKKLEKSATMEQQRMFSKILDALEVEGEIELSDEKFDFLWDAFNTPYDLATFIPAIVDYLETVKLAK